MTLYKRKYARKGQGLVEFALVLPFLLMLAFGIIDFAQVSFTFAQAQNSLREAVRLANVFGYPGSSVPSYLACTNIEQTAENIFFATSAEAKVSYVKSRVGAKTPAPGNWAIGDTFECGSSPYGTETNGKSNLQNGDIMKIELDVTINFITPFLSSAYPAFDMHFEAQRTIVKDIRLGGDNDRDGDGLDDCWEEIHFGTPPIDCTDDDYSAIEIWDAFSDPDLDGCNNGCEETHMLDPNNPDTDGDGLKDGEEIYVYGTNPKNEDTDGDDLLDGQEVYGNHPNNTHGYITDPLLWSTDEDCLSDGDEIIIHKTNPLVADTDGDEEDDCEEVGGGTDPNNQDTDSDGLTDGEERNVYLTDPFNPDTDGDGLLDGYEVHTSGTNPNLFDTDGDSMGDGDELRFHNGIENNPAPYNVGGYASDPLKEHSDNDRLPDDLEVKGMVITLMWPVHENPANSPIEKTVYTDPKLDDTDGDGLTDEEEVKGIYVQGVKYTSDPTNTDTDGDGRSDGDEIFIYGTNPDDPRDGEAASNIVDTDDDGLDDDWEIFWFGSIEAYNGTDDPDSDGCNNLCEYYRDLNPNNEDTDNDGLLDGQEVYNEPFPDPKNPDTDGDGLLDGQEVNGMSVNPPGGTPAFYTSNPTRIDSDHDTLSDYDEIMVYFTNPRSIDTDNDGLYDQHEVGGFTITVMGEERTVYPKPYLADTDSDGLDDRREINGVPVVSTGNQIIVVKTDPTIADTDGDGLSDGDETNGYVVTIIVDNGTPVDVTVRTDPTKVDTDEDGLSDGAEALTHKTNPMVVDTDQDGLSDGQEINGVFVDLPDGAYSADTTYFSNPLLTDTDGDTLKDGDEVNLHLSNPNAVDTDSDGLTDAEEVNGKVVNIGTHRQGADASGNRRFTSSPIFVDTDGDGLTDAQEMNGLTRNGVVYYSNPQQIDSDSDGRTDKNELDEFTGTPQYALRQTDPLMVDTDGDGVNDGQELVNGTLPNNVVIISVSNSNPEIVKEPGKNKPKAQAVFTVTLSKVSPENTQVGWFTNGQGTATPGVDYDVGSGTITIPAGSTSATFIVYVIGDNSNERNQIDTFYVQLRNQVNGSILTTAPFNARIIGEGKITD